MTPARQPPRPPPARKPVGGVAQRAAPHPLSQTAHTSDQATGSKGRPTSNGTVLRCSSTPSRTTTLLPPPPPPPRRNGTVTTGRPHPRVSGQPAPAARPNTTFDNIVPSAVPPRMSAPQRVNTASSISTQSSQDNAGVNKKLELWRRRLERAQEVLEGRGVALYTWRNGQDVMREAVGIVRTELGAQK
ncbi:hypothetical protein VUR80DRAFT_6624 [Thermomyces stellatus]